MYRIFMILTLMVFSVSGVVASEDKGWLTNPPADTAKYFYAVGYGDTQDEAKSDALSSVSAKISVEVASSFSSSVTASRQGTNEYLISESKNDIVSKSKNIEYSDVRIVKNIKTDGQEAVLVEVDREILSASYERKLLKVDNKLKAEWDVFKDSGVFEKLKLSVTINSYLKETDTFFPLLHALDSTYDDSKYTKRYLNYTKEMRKAKDELVFKITSDENSEPLASLIRSELSAQNASFNSKKYNILIDITTKAKKKKYPSTNEKFANLTFALRKTTIKATDRDGNEVSNTVYKTKSGSSEGYKDAIARTSKYEKKIKDKGIVAFITGN